MPNDRILTDEQRAFYDTNGYLIVRGVFSRARVDELHEALEQLMKGDNRKQLRSALDFTRPDKTVMTQLQQVHRISPVFRDHVHDPTISRIAAELMQTREVRLWHDQVIYKRPHDGGGVSWHQDYGYWQHAEPPEMVSSWTALDPTTEANGCMFVIPGSHQWGLLPANIMDAFTYDIDRYLKKSVPEEYREKVETKVPCVMEPGDVEFHHCLTVHGSYENKSDNYRRGLICHYLPESARYNAGNDPTKGKSHEVDVPDGAPFASDNFPLLYRAEA